jgi:hypothetical protein
MALSTNVTGLAESVPAGSNGSLRPLAAHEMNRSDGVLAVSASCDAGASHGELRRQAWVLLGAVAEPAASLRERRDGDAAVFEVVTGIPDGAGPFASHGHTLRLTIQPAP